MSAPEELRPDDRPDPNTLPCHECGHVWFPGERRHVYLADDAQRPADAVVLCALCRRQRQLRPPQTDPQPQRRVWTHPR